MSLERETLVEATKFLDEVSESFPALKWQWDFSGPNHILSGRSDKLPGVDIKVYSNYRGATPAWQSSGFGLTGNGSSPTTSITDLLACIEKTVLLIRSK